MAALIGPGCGGDGVTATVGAACFLRVAATHDRLPRTPKAEWQTSKQSRGLGRSELMPGAQGIREHFHILKAAARLWEGWRGPGGWTASGALLLPRVV